ncbi:hypothetical protein [Oenococcus sicerae]|uniref:hypothetical protein n=1 Tax=Oenococcus sicerae TaxID=2203724 RepID=UPI0039EC158C
MANNEGLFDLIALKTVDTIVLPGTSSKEFYAALEKLDAGLFRNQEKLARPGSFSTQIGIHFQEISLGKQEDSLDKVWKFDMMLWTIYQTISNEHYIYTAVKLTGSTHNQNIKEKLLNQEEVLSFFNDNYEMAVAPAANQTVSSIFSLTSIFENIPNSPILLNDKIKGLHFHFHDQKK